METKICLECDTPICSETLESSGDILQFFCSLDCRDYFIDNAPPMSSEALFQWAEESWVRKQDFLEKKTARSRPYNVAITSDHFDRTEPRANVTAGTIRLDGETKNWHIELGDEKWYMPTNPEVPRPPQDGGWAGAIGFDLLVNGSRDFRSRPDARDIYEVIAEALQERRHPDDCDCRRCYDRHLLAVAEIVEELREQGLTIDAPEADLKALGIF